MERDTRTRGNGNWRDYRTEIFLPRRNEFPFVYPAKLHRSTNSLRLSIYATHVVYALSPRYRIGDYIPLVVGMRQCAA